MTLDNDLDWNVLRLLSLTHNFSAYIALITWSESGFWLISSPNNQNNFVGTWPGRALAIFLSISLETEHQMVAISFAFLQRPIAVLIQDIMCNDRNIIKAIGAFDYG